MPTISLVTTTHDRPLCFSLLEKWIGGQSVQPDQWVVVNDSDHPEEYKYTLGQEVLVRQSSGDLPSLCQNWLAAVPLVAGEHILVCEDDDWYHEDWIRTLSGVLGDVDLAGVSHDVYWKFPSRKFVRMHNDEHASLAASGFMWHLLPHMERIARLGDIFIDLQLWKEPVVKKLLPQPLPDKRMLHVGLKNMPGAKGLGIGHQSPTGSTDTNFGMLTEWIGREAAQIYRALWWGLNSPNPPGRRSAGLHPLATAP